MSRSTGFFDPASNGFDLGDFLLLGGGVIVVAVWSFLRKWVVVPIRRSAKDAFITQVRLVVRDEIAHATRPIQPDANGGKSLPDVAANTDWTKDAICAIAAHIGIDLPPAPCKTPTKE